MAVNVLSMTRGDTAKFKFTRLDNDGNPILTEADELYFTVKSSADNFTPEFQITLEDMEFDSTSGQYSFVVLPAMTNGLNFNSKHFYDVEVIQDNVKTTISFGQFKLLPEVTWQGNEAQ